MRSILLLIVFSTATASLGADFARSDPSSSNTDRVDKEKRTRLRGLARGWQRVPGRANPFIAELVEDVLEGEDDDKDVVLIYEEVEDGMEDEVIAVVFRDNEDEDELIADLVNEWQDTTSETVRWAKNPRKNTKGGESVSSEDNKRRKKGEMKRKKRKKRPTKKGERLPKSPPAEPRHAFPTFAPSVTNEPTASPSTPKPTEKPTTYAPATYAPTTYAPTTYAPTTEEIFASTESTAQKKATQCPPHYSVSATYTAGDTSEEYSSIYQCQPPPYEAYCNIVEKDESWNDTIEQLWEDAWVNVGDCDKVMVENGVDPATIVPIASTASITSATVITTEDTVVTTTEAPVTSEISQLTPCPSHYDTSKTAYIAGEQITVNSHIFECSEIQGYDIYCNIAVWNDSLLDQDQNAKQMWTNAWVDVGNCAPTQEELMEEEVAGNTGDA